MRSENIGKSKIIRKEVKTPVKVKQDKEIRGKGWSLINSGKPIGKPNRVKGRTSVAAKGKQSTMNVRGEETSVFKKF